MSLLKLIYQNNLRSLCYVGTMVLVSCIFISSINADSRIGIVESVNVDNIERQADPISIMKAKSSNIHNVSSLDYNNNLYIDSNTLTINKSKNTSHFQGSVIIHFKDLIIYTSEVEVIYKNDNSNTKVDSTQIDPSAKIDKIIIPNKLQAIKEKNDEALIANEGIYIWDESKLTLTGDIMFIHNGSILKTQKLVYYTL